MCIRDSGDRDSEPAQVGRRTLRCGGAPRADVRHVQVTAALADVRDRLAEARRAGSRQDHAAADADGALHERARLLLPVAEAEESERGRTMSNRQRKAERRARRRHSTPPPDRRALAQTQLDQWVAVRHADDHVHVVATLARRRPSWRATVSNRAFPPLPDWLPAEDRGGSLGRLETFLHDGGNRWDHRIASAMTADAVTAALAHSTRPVRLVGAATGATAQIGLQAHSTGQPRERI